MADSPVQGSGTEDVFLAEYAQFHDSWRDSMSHAPLQPDGKQGYYHGIIVIDSRQKLTLGYLRALADTSVRVNDFGLAMWKNAELSNVSVRWQGQNFLTTFSEGDDEWLPKVVALMKARGMIDRFVFWYK